MYRPNTGPCHQWVMVVVVVRRCDCWVEEEEEECFNVSGISLEVAKLGGGAGKGGNGVV